jgi:hypothetical protein
VDHHFLLGVVFRTALDIAARCVHALVARCRTASHEPPGHRGKPVLSKPTGASANSSSGRNRKRRHGAVRQDTTRRERLSRMRVDAIRRSCQLHHFASGVRLENAVRMKEIGWMCCRSWTLKSTDYVGSGSGPNQRLRIYHTGTRVANDFYRDASPSIRSTISSTLLERSTTSRRTGSIDASRAHCSMCLPCSPSARMIRGA